MKTILNQISNLIKEISKLIKVKSLISLMTTYVFCNLASKGDITPTEFLTIFATIMGFYYGVQTTKGKE